MFEMTEPRNIHCCALEVLMIQLHKTVHYYSQLQALSMIVC